MKRFSLSVLLIVIGLSGLTLTGEASTYQWTDESGGVHLTDNPDTVPPKYMKRAKESDSIKGKVVKPSPETANQSTSPYPEQPVTKQVPLYGGYGEYYWRSSFASIRAEIRKQESALAEKRENLIQLRRKRIMHNRGSDRLAYNDLEQEIGRDEATLKIWQEKLKTLVAEAENAAVPSEWRQ